LAALFMLTSVSLAVLAGGHSSGGGSIVNETPGAPQSDGMTPVPTLPTTPTVPTTE